MKLSSTINRNFFNSINHNHKCENYSALSALRSLWVRWLSHVVRKIRSLSRRPFAIRSILAGLIASLTSLSHLRHDRRKVIGVVLLLMGIFSLVAHKIFSDPFVEDHLFCSVLGFRETQCWNGSDGWCYTSGYWYWHQVCWFVALLFWSVSLILFIPVKYSLAFIPASFFHAVGWCWIIHYSFFSDSYESINAIPEATIMIVALALGFGIVMSSDAALYWENHKKRGNWARFAGVAEMDLPAEVKEPIYRSLAKEYRKINEMI